MPAGEPYWNPYRWVTISDSAVEHDVPRYHHRLSGLSGRLWCELEALTPLLIGDGHGQFVRHGNRAPYLPATSLKGAIRSLAEVVGNAAVPFPKVSVDEPHRLASARHGSQLDVTARMFGYLDGGSVFAGLVRFSDAELLVGHHSPADQWPRYTVAVGQPKPTHGAFYPAKNRRKFYHHHPGAERLTAPHPNIKQTTNVQPAPPGTRFHFTVDYGNLRDEELDLLLYCMVLEERTTVVLGPAALGGDADQPSVTLSGPLRHKLGYAKPHGAGSVRIRITKLSVREDQVARYRGGNDSVETLEGDSLSDELGRRTERFRDRTDRTMKELRALLIYTTADPRNPIQYPTYQWFRTGSQTALRPTI